MTSDNSTSPGPDETLKPLPVTTMWNLFHAVWGESTTGGYNKARWIQLQDAIRAALSCATGAPEWREVWIQSTGPRGWTPGKNMGVMLPCATGEERPLDDEWTPEQMEKLRLDFEAWLSKRNVPDDVRAMLLPWKAGLARPEDPDAGR